MSKIYYFSFLFCVLLLFGKVKAQSTSLNCRTRPDFSQLSSEERQSFFNAVLALKRRPSAGTNAPPSKISYDDLVNAHWQMTGPAHGNAMFLVWHRYNLWVFEEALRSIDPTVVLPYWDTALDSQQPHRSRIFSSENFGGNGGGTDRCVQDGAFANWSVTVPPERAWTKCLRRCFDGGQSIQPFWPPEPIHNLIRNSRTYDSFRSSLEGGPHSRVHFGIGGQCGDMGQMYSPNDPLFYLHHANIDRIYYKWQKLCPAFVNEFNGNGPDGRPSNANDRIPLFNVPVHEVLNLEGRYCVRYTRAPTEIDLTIDCPGSFATSSTPSTSPISPVGRPQPTSHTNNPSNNNNRNINNNNNNNNHNNIINNNNNNNNNHNNIINNNNNNNNNNNINTHIDPNSWRKVDLTKLNMNDDWFIRSLGIWVMNPKIAFQSTRVQKRGLGTSERDSSNYIPVAYNASFIKIGQQNITSPNYEPPKTLKILAPNNNDDDLIHIRYPPFLPESYSKMMKLDLKELRKTEIEAYEVIDKFNNQSGYISKAALKYARSYYQKKKCGARIFNI